MKPTSHCVLDQPLRSLGETLRALYLSLGNHPQNSSLHISVKTHWISYDVETSNQKIELLLNVHNVGPNDLLPHCWDQIDMIVDVNGAQPERRVFDICEDSGEGVKDGSGQCGEFGGFGLFEGNGGFHFRYVDVLDVAGFQVLYLLSPPRRLDVEKRLLFFRNLHEENLLVEVVGVLNLLQEFEDFADENLFYPHEDWECLYVDGLDESWRAIVSVPHDHL